MLDNEEVKIIIKKSSNIPFNGKVDGDIMVYLRMKMKN